MAAWCKPERMLLIATEESLRSPPRGEDIQLLLARVAGLRPSIIQVNLVAEPAEEDIYRAVRDFLRRPGVVPREVFVDPTGGKKSMSASAALAGFVEGAPIVYVDYTEYEERGRIPVPGTEYPRLLTNPLEVLGDRDMERVYTTFNGGDFTAAEELARALADRLYEPREAECLAELAKGYGAWDRFEFEAASQALEMARALLTRFGENRNWRWAPGVRPALERNMEALEALRRVEEKPQRVEEGAPLIAWYLAAADRLLSAGRLSQALLLIYACIERYSNLCLWVDFGLDANNPDYDSVSKQMDETRYVEAGSRLFRQDYKFRKPHGRLTFTKGLQLLAALNKECLRLDDLGRLRCLANARNKCEYEHGFLPQVPKRDEVEEYLETARDIVSQACGGRQALEMLLGACRFPKLKTAPTGG